MGYIETEVVRNYTERAPVYVCDFCAKQYAPPKQFFKNSDEDVGTYWIKANYIPPGWYNIVQKDFAGGTSTHGIFCTKDCVILYLEKR